MAYSELSRAELIKLCKENSLKGYSTKKKNELVAMLEEGLNSTDNSKSDTKNQDFSELSIQITKSLTSDVKKNNGIYFTPKSIIKDTLNTISKYHTPKFVLEPSCGSCEFITQLDSVYDNLDITGIELNSDIFKQLDVSKVISKDTNKLKLENADFLKYEAPKKYDLIVGNPPYFVMSKSSVDKKYLEYFDGRPNIFVLFIVKSFELLDTNGILAFVLPNNFLNSMYYNKVRDHINKNYTIIDIQNHAQSDYLETQQDTCVLVVQNCKDTKKKNNNFTHPVHNRILFNTQDNIKTIKKLYRKSVSLDVLGFDVKVGSVVWNEHKDILTDDDTKTLLIYSSDIKDNKLSIKQYMNDEKKNYIDKEGSTDINLVINRGYGKGAYKFSYLLVDQDTPYLIENHLICIKPREDIDRDTLKNKYNKIIKSFNDVRTAEFIEMYFGNNAISTTELQYILPIYDI